jgi:homoserine O-succinyltransferase
MHAIVQSPGGAPLDVALVNNMPDQAVEATEAQFLRLLRAGGPDVPFRLRRYALPSVPRSQTARHAMAQSHDDIEALYARGADVLIVTGAEPRAERLEDEPFWEEFGRLVDWARAHTFGSLWSCLAAHGAVLRLDGVQRRPAGAKVSGVFRCDVAGDDWTAQGAGASILVPHSRYNGVSREDLQGCGYQIASWSEVGVDSFWRRTPSLFLFTQGHPEYDADTLLREFRRDALRFIDGQSPTFPQAPANYFSAAARTEFAELAARASALSRRLFSERLSRILEQECPASSWAGDAARLYRNWLAMAAAEKILRLRRA